MTKPGGSGCAMLLVHFRCSATGLYSSEHIKEKRAAEQPMYRVYRAVLMCHNVFAVTCNGQATTPDEQEHAVIVLEFAISRDRRMELRGGAELFSPARNRP